MAWALDVRCKGVTRAIATAMQCQCDPYYGGHRWDQLDYDDINDTPNPYHTLP